MRAAPATRRAERRSLRGGGPQEDARRRVRVDRKGLQYMRICVVIPSYNHGGTLRRVLCGAAECFPVIVVDDGSTDGTGGLLAGADCAAVVRHPVNRGKGAALLSGFKRATSLGYTHAVTIDADGQHSATDIPALVEAATDEPEAFIIGVRNIAAAGAPAKRQTANTISNFWFRVETGIALGDTQCGFRCYPLAATLSLITRSSGYGYELEVLVRAVWAGYRIAAVPVQVDYDAPSSRRSHFRPVVDFTKISRLHARLTCQSMCLPPAVRRRRSVVSTAPPGVG